MRTNPFEVAPLKWIIICPYRNWSKLFSFCFVFIFLFVGNILFCFDYFIELIELTWFVVAEYFYLDFDFDFFQSKNNKWHKKRNHMERNEQTTEKNKYIDIEYYYGTIKMLVMMMVMTATTTKTKTTTTTIITTITTWANLYHWILICNEIIVRCSIMNVDSKFLIVYTGRVREREQKRSVEK